MKIPTQIKKCACGRDAVMYRRYEGHYYCGRCLTYQVERMFRKTVRKHGLIKDNDRIVVAVSGGKDSSTLLYLMKKITAKNRSIKLSALIIDEGMKKYRPECIKAAKKLCKKLGVKLHVVKFSKLGTTLEKIAKHTDKTCTYCGVFRRYLLNREARRLGATKLAVGHNLDDECQAILMNMMRTDVGRFTRLGPMPGDIRDKKFVPRIKPLRNVPEKEIALYALVNGIDFCRGSCPYAFDNVRRDVKILINDIEEKYPGTKMQVVKFYDELMKKVQKHGSKGKLDYCEKCGEPSSTEMCKSCQLLARLRKKCR